MPKWIKQLSVTRSPEHVLNQHQHARASGYGPLRNGIGVVRVQGYPHTSSTQRLRHFASTTFLLTKNLCPSRIISPCTNLLPSGVIMRCPSAAPNAVL